MVKNVVILVYWPVTSREKTQYGFDALKARGFNVQVCDVTLLCNKAAIERNPVVNELNEDYIYKLSSFVELENFLKNTASNSIFMDYMRGLADLDIKTQKVFRLLKKYNIKYFTIITAALPTPEIELKPQNWYRWFFSRVKNTLNPIKLYDYIIRKSIAFLRGKRLIYPLPVRIFSTDTPQVGQFLLKYNLNDSVVVKMHNPDYYDFLRYSSTLNHNSDEIPKPYCVFIDEGMVGHPDFDICAVEKLDAQSYIIEINKILNHVESDMGMKVIIAAHPRSKLEILKTVYPDRTILQGKTLQLIAGSDFVMAHLSTVVGFAALIKKPMVLIETPDMKKIYYYHMTIHAMASALGLHPFQTDIEELNKLNEYRHCSLAKYDQYVARYVKTSGVSDEDMWDIVYQEIIKEL